MPVALKTSAASSLLYVQRRQRTTALAELSVVRTAKIVVTYDTAETVPAGSVGTIVVVHDGGTAYDVEFEVPVGVASILAEDVVPFRS